MNTWKLIKVFGTLLLIGIIMLFLMLKMRECTEDKETGAKRSITNELIAGQKKVLFVDCESQDALIQDVYTPNHSKPYFIKLTKKCAKSCVEWANQLYVTRDGVCEWTQNPSLP